VPQVPEHGRLTRGVLHDRVVDAAAIVVSLILGLLLWGLTADAAEPMSADEELLFALDALVGLLLCLALWWRRRWPVALTVVALTVGCWSAAGGPASIVLVWTVVVSRPLRTTWALIPLLVAATVVFPVVHPDPSIPFLVDVTLGLVITAVFVLSALYVRARRQLAALTLEQARLAVGEREKQVAEARRTERTRIAREMHDVLAHRLSLLSMHAGALEYRPDAPPAELAAAAGVVRQNAHSALEELREVIDVLREDPHGALDKPWPTVADLPQLVAESVAAGQLVRLTLEGLGADDVPASLGRTVYRVVQEGLTNARKYAPGAPVRVVLRGRPGGCLETEVVNGRPEAAGGRPVPGARTGLVGLRERAELLGGTLECGPTADGCFRLVARLPWPA
jgi:signal transduction histidine kinase